MIKIPIPAITVKSPTAASGCYKLNDAACAAPISAQQAVIISYSVEAVNNATFTAGGTSVAEAIGATLNNGISADDEVNTFH